LSDTARGSPPARRSTSDGTVGRNAGRTTPDVLLQVEMTPVTNATTPYTVVGVLRRAMSALMLSMPPAFSARATSVATPPGPPPQGAGLVGGAESEEDDGGGERREADGQAEGDDAEDPETDED